MLLAGEGALRAGAGKLQLAVAAAVAPASQWRCRSVVRSGSGDVQGRLVAGLLARGAEPAQVAVWGGWLHGTAGDRLAASAGPVGFLVREPAPLVPGLVAEVGG